jgi:hypothetical protein
MAITVSTGLQHRVGYDRFLPAVRFLLQKVHKIDHNTRCWIVGSVARTFAHGEQFLTDFMHDPQEYSILKSLQNLESGLAHQLAMDTSLDYTPAIFWCERPAFRNDCDCIFLNYANTREHRCDNVLRSHGQVFRHIS